MKQILTYFLCSLFFVLSGCSRNEKPTLALPIETSVQDHLLSDADISTQYSLISSDPEILFATQLKATYTLILGRYSRKETLPLQEKDGEITYYYFTISRVLRGIFIESEIAVSISEKVLQFTNLTEGHLYVLPVGYMNDIHMPEKKYTVSCFIIPVNEDETLEPFHFASVPSYVKTDYPFHSVDELIAYCSNIVDLSQNGPIDGWPFTLSEDIRVIIETAPFVCIGSFSGLYDEHGNPNFTIDFNVYSCLKGSLPQKPSVRSNSDGKPVFSIFRDYEVMGINPDRLYVVAGSFNDEEMKGKISYGKVFARKNAVIPFDDTDRVQQVYDALGIQPEP